jgi:hypothetical protein
MVDDSSWEPDGVTLQVRFCEGGSAYHENEIAAATLRCGLARLHKLAGVNPAQVIASHEPGIEPCRHIGNDVLDA